MLQVRAPRGCRGQPAEPRYSSANVTSYSSAIGDYEEASHSSANVTCYSSAISDREEASYSSRT